MLLKLRFLILTYLVIAGVVLAEFNDDLSKKKVVEVQAKLQKYLFKKIIITKGGEQIDDDDIVTIVNTETNQSLPIVGNVEGIRFVGNHILQVNTYVGAHVHTVRFYTIHENGDLALIKYSEINSDIGIPGVYTSPLNETITVFSHHTSSTKNNCHKLMEDAFVYNSTDNMFNNLYEKKVINVQCTKESEAGTEE